MTTFRQLNNSFKIIGINQRIEVMRDLAHCEDRSAPVVGFARNRLLNATTFNNATVTDSDWSLFFDYYKATCPEDFKLETHKVSLEEDWRWVMTRVKEFQDAMNQVCDADAEDRFMRMIDLFKFESQLKAQIDTLSNRLRVDLYQFGECLQALGQSDAGSGVYGDLCETSGCFRECMHVCLETLEAELDLERLIEMGAFEVLWAERLNARGVA